MGIYDGICQANYIITMPDGSKWRVPVFEIAIHRASYYSRIDAVPYIQSLEGDTIPLFTNDHGQIADWAKNNMDWKDVVAHATQIKDGSKVDFQEGWTNGEWEIEE